MTRRSTLAAQVLFRGVNWVRRAKEDICVHHTTRKNQNQPESTPCTELQLQHSGNGKQQDVNVSEYIDRRIQDRDRLGIILAILVRELRGTNT